jgi:hypothetical protein
VCGRRGILVVASLLLAVVVACEREHRAVREDLPAARAERARADAQSIASAVGMYAATFGTLPDSLAALTSRTTASDGHSGGPFLRGIPAPPPGWAAYEYRKRDGDAFTITTAGEGLVISVP